MAQLWARIHSTTGVARSNPRIIALHKIQIEPGQRCQVTRPACPFARPVTRLGVPEWHPRNAAGVTDTRIMRAACQVPGCRRRRRKFRTTSKFYICQNWSCTIGAASERKFNSQNRCSITICNGSLCREPWVPYPWSGSTGASLGWSPAVGRPISGKHLFWSS